MVIINRLAQMAIDMSGKTLKINNLGGEEFLKSMDSHVRWVRGRNSDNKLYIEKIGWEPEYSLRDGMKTFDWIDKQKMTKYLNLIRVKHWVKNLFIFIPLFFSSKFFEQENLKITIYSFLAFSFVTSFVYIINDILDIQYDKIHSKEK